MDRSGSINHPDELKQLCINLVTKLRITGLRIEELEEIVATASDDIVDNPMDLPEFLEWFDTEIRGW